MSLYKKLLVAGVAMMAGLTLNGYLGSGASANITSDNSIASSRISYKKAKKENKHNKVYKLAFFENRTTYYDDEDLFYTIGYYSHGKIAYKNVSTRFSSDRFVEVIQADLDTPYVVKTDYGWYIHRPPYSTMYNSQESNISGKVSDKSE